MILDDISKHTYDSCNREIGCTADRMVDTLLDNTIRAKPLNLNPDF